MPSSASALLADHYQLTMLSAYYERGMEDTAVFEFFVRRLPEKRNFLVAAGLEQVLDYIEGLHFTQQELAQLEATGKFKPLLLDRLAKFKFSGDVYAMPEGTVCFADEPLLRVIAPLPEAQLLESRIVNILNFQTMIASKAARCRIAAGHRHLSDFGMRRAHGAEAALLATRASYIAGFDATSNVEAGDRYRIPLSGTMAHSFIEAHDHEADAFRTFARCYQGDLTLLIDTYDIQRGARRVVEVAQELASSNIKVKQVRIDSGDLDEESRRVRTILDRGGCEQIEIFASGGLDEYSIAKLVRDDAPITGFGVGTALTASTDAAALDCAYKLQQYAGKPRRKCSPGKSTWPGRRQVYRTYDDGGRIAMDVVGCADEIMEGRLLLHHVMQGGHRIGPSPSLDEIRRHHAQEMNTLPAQFKTLEHGPRSPAKISHGLRELAAEVDRESH
jgi:nicotinate phosphoribosyltransferase